MCRRETNGAPAFQQHWQQSQYPWQSVSLPTFPPTPSLSLPPFGLLCAQKKKDKLISIQMEWEPAAQGPSGIANISSLPGSRALLLLGHYPLSFILLFLLSFSSLLSYWLTSTIHPCLCWPFLSSFLQNHHSNKRKKTSSYNVHRITVIHFSPSDLISVQQKITLLQRWTQFSFQSSLCNKVTLHIFKTTFGANIVLTFKYRSLAREQLLSFSFNFFLCLFLLQHPSILASLIASAQCPHSWAHMVSSSCQVSIGAGAQIAWRWSSTQASCQLWTQRQQGGATEGKGFNRLCTAQCVDCVL